MKITRYIFSILGIIHCLSAMQQERLDFKADVFDSSFPIVNHKLENNLFLAAIPITHHNLKGWEDFAESAVKFMKDRTDHPVNQIDKAANTFAEHLIPYHSWVIVASSAEYHPTIAVELIEMVMTATTDTDSNFVKHMGIFRNPQFKGANHRNMSLKMHWFSAKILPSLKPNIQLIISHPLPIMAQILQKAFPNDILCLKLSQKKNWPMMLSKNFSASAQAELLSKPKWLMGSSYGQDDTITLPIEAVINSGIDRKD